MSCAGLRSTIQFRFPQQWNIQYKCPARVEVIISFSDHLQTVSVVFKYWEKIKMIYIE